MKDYSNYHNANPNDKIFHDGNLMLEHSLDGFEGYDVTINETVETKVMIYNKYGADSDSKSIIGYPSDIERGNVVKVNADNWLVISYPEDNKIYRKAEMRLCNATFPIISDKTKVLIGRDDRGKPYYEDQYAINKQEPCIVESGNYKADNDQQLSLPNDTVSITLKYQPSDSLVINFEFELYEQKFKVTNIDKTKVIKGIGVIKILAERV